MAEFLGLTRPGAYVRMEREKWSGTVKATDGVKVPSSVVRESRERELKQLLSRAKMLEELAELHEASDELESIRLKTKKK